MKENKRTILIGFPLTVAALAGAWYLDGFRQSFWSNVLLGLFGSGFLTLLVAIVNYMTKRREALENFWTLGHKAARAFNKYPLDGSPEEKMEAILLINEFDFDAVGDAYAAIDFLLGNKKSRMKIGLELYAPIRDAGRTIADSAFNITRLRRAIPRRMDVLEPYISNVDNVLIKTEVTDHECDDGRQIEAKDICIRMTDLCYGRFNGFYWKLMYPWKKSEKKTE